MKKNFFLTFSSRLGMPGHAHAYNRAYIEPFICTQA